MYIYIHILTSGARTVRVTSLRLAHQYTSSAHYIFQDVQATRTSSR